MKPISTSRIIDYVENNIGEFHRRRLESLASLKLDKLLKSKNPYLFKAKNITLSQDFIKIVLDAYLSSQEETIFGNILEGLARFINGKIYGGQKSSSPGIDLEFVKNNIRYLVSIKSGPHWGNSEQIKKMIDNFKTAKVRIRQHNPEVTVVAVNGCCYGKDSRPDKGEYFKYCGQQFWEFISGNENLYLEIIVPLGYKAREKNEAFYKDYSKLVNVFTSEFNHKYCKDGTINWEELAKFNSAKPVLKPKR